MKSKKANLTGVREIAKRANVSIGTVDRVIHNRKGVSEKTRKKINSIITELRFRPNKMASLLAKKNVVNLSVVIPASSKQTDYWSYPLAGIKQAISEIEQFGIIVTYHFYDLDSKASFVKACNQVLAKEKQGVLLAPSFIEESTVFTKKLFSENIPFVFINSDLSRVDFLSYIGPNLYQSGRLAAQLLSMMIVPNDDIFVINISTVLEPDHHILRKEQGFRQYFEENDLQNRILTLNINHTQTSAIEKQISKALDSAPKAKALFVTNSRVSIIAKVLKKSNASVLLVGYDFIENNIKCLRDGTISFLISQRPKQQGYLGIMALYKHIFAVEEVKKTSHMPIDIITKENLEFYIN